MDCSPPDSTVQGESPGKNTGVGCCVLLQGIFLTQGLNPCLLCLLHWQVGFLPLVTPGKPCSLYTCVIIWSVFVAPWRQRQWLVLFIFISSVPGLVLSHGRHSTNVMSEWVNALVLVIKRNHCITDIFFPFFGWGLAVHQKVFIELVWGREYCLLLYFLIVPWYMVCEFCDVIPRKTNKVYK